MPIYEYQCERCGVRTEAIQRLAEPPLTECPQCGGPLRKLVSAPAFQFKGSGWYVTDYAAKSESKERGGESSAKATGESSAASSGGETKGDAKGESKSESKGESKPAGGASGSTKPDAG